MNLAKTQFAALIAKTALSTAGGAQDEIDVISAFLAALEAEIALNRREFIFINPQDIWPLPHNRGKYPTSCRILVKSPVGNSELLEYSAARIDIDVNNSVVNLGAGLAGRCELGFS